MFLSIHASIQSSIHPCIHSIIHPSMHPLNHPCIHASIQSSIHPSYPKPLTQPHLFFPHNPHLNLYQNLQSTSNPSNSTHNFTLPVSAHLSPSLASPFHLCLLKLFHQTHSSSTTTLFPTHNPLSTIPHPITHNPLPPITSTHPLIKPLS